MIKNYIEKAKLRKYVSIVTQVRKLNSSMGTESTRNLKRKFGSSSDRIEKLAVLMEMSRRFLGKTPFDVQLIAALAMNDGYVLNMFTGEGKTIAGAMAAALFASDGKQVVVTTANDYLSKRDSDMMRPLFNSVGIESGFLGQNLNATVMFKSLTSACLDWLNGFAASSVEQISQKSLFEKRDTVMIVDEIDYSLIELSVSPVHIVTEMISDYDPDLIYNLVLKADSNEAFYQTTKEGQLELTERFYDFADQFLTSELNIEPSELNSTEYRRYVEFQNAWLAQYALVAGRDYVVDGDAGVIKKFNKRTGRSTAGGFNDGVLAFLHKKEHLPPPVQREEIITSTLKYYIHSFETVVGMSGTSECNEMELKKTYGLKVFKIPARLKSKLVNHGYAIYDNDTSKDESLVAFVNERLASGQPVLLVCEDNAAANKYFDLFSKTEHFEVILLLGEDHFDEAELIKDAGKSQRLTITTRMCARGTDITVEHDEGLSLVVSGVGVTDVDDLQLNGRTARSGKKGDVIFFTSVKDPIFSGFKEHTVAYDGLLMNCQKFNTENPAKINFDLSGDAVTFVRRVQLQCVKLMREKRNLIIAYQSPIESQLEIIKKKRFELWNLNNFDADLSQYIQKIIDLVYANNEPFREQASMIMARFYSVNADYKAVVVALLNSRLTDLWGEHNRSMRMLLADSFSNGGGMDVGKYQNKCHELFVEFARTLNEKLIDHVVGTCNGWLVEYDRALKGDVRLGNIIKNNQVADLYESKSAIQEVNALIEQVKNEEV
ncbi:hypothetical protein [Photobacterium damselae]|uniref:preprotein translocase subunit SecA n=1 Tax=Photobacterium damselae TaxID=38293 RepID=UPI001F3172C6|nr:hypothetical protein [Photobacterium damselae]UKA04646.1 hypothetical protein IHC89_23795 [Photobacterium damselae subsp. damselae]